MLTNAALGGALGAAYLTILVLQLNPNVPLISASAWHWFVLFVCFYGLHLTIAIYLLTLIREAFAAEPLHPGWMSVRLLAWVSAVLAGAAALLMWANLKGFRAVLTADAFERARLGATITTVAAAILLVVAIARYSFGRRGSRATAVGLFITVIASVIVPLGVRGPGDIGWMLPSVHAIPLPPSADPTPTVRLILLDGASLSFIRERVGMRRLPNFGRILDRGASKHLATQKPTQPDPIWAAAATGKYPPKNGVRSAGLYRARAGDSDVVDLLPDYCFAYSLPYLGLVKEQDVNVTSLRARPLWEILDDYGIVAGIVRWPLTFPARANRGYVISDRFELGGSSPLRRDDAQAAAPTSAVDIARDVFDAAELEPRPASLPPASPLGASLGGVGAARWDAVYAEAAAQLNAQFAPKLTAMRYTGIDIVAHAYLRYAEPALFGDVSISDQQQYGGVLDTYYAYVDDEVGRAIATLAPDDLLIVVAGFGMEPETLQKRLLARALWPAGAIGHARGGARRIPIGLRRERRARPVRPRRDGRAGANGAVLPGAADRPRHGRLRARRLVCRRLHARPSDHVHPDA